MRKARTGSVIRVIERRLAYIRDEQVLLSGIPLGSLELSTKRWHINAFVVVLLIGGAQTCELYGKGQPSSARDSLSLPDVAKLTDSPLDDGCKCSRDQTGRLLRL
jgi:hypothetical protein